MHTGRWSGESLAHVPCLGPTSRGHRDSESPVDQHFLRKVRSDHRYLVQHKPPLTVRFDADILGRGIF